MIVKRLFAISENQELWVFLNSFDWDFTQHGPVILQIDDKEIRCHSFSCSNVDNTAVLILRLQDSNFPDVEEVAKIFNKCTKTVHLRRNNESVPG